MPTLLSRRHAALTAASLLSLAIGLSACATNNAPGAAAAGGAASVASVGGQRDLSPQEKKVIMDAVTPSLRNPNAARFKWAKLQASPGEDSVNYCATVDALSPYPAYSGNQAYIVEAHMSGGQVTSAVIGLIAGGKDFALVTKMCEKYGLDPKNAS